MIVWENRHKTHKYKIKIGKCEICGLKNNLETHHKNKNPLDNDEKNLLVVCKKCHWSVCHKNKHVGEGNPMYGKKKSGIICKNGKLFGSHNSYDKLEYRKKQSVAKKGLLNPNCKKEVGE